VTSTEFSPRLNARVAARHRARPRLLLLTDVQHAARFEIRRLRTVRSTFVLLALAIAASFTSLVAAKALASLGRSQGSDGAALNSSYGSWISVATAPMAAIGVILSILGAMAVGHEIRYGTTPLVLVGFPRRFPLLAGKFVVLEALAVVGSVIVISLGLVWVILSHSWSAIGGDQVSHAAVVATLARIAIASACYALIGIATTCLTNSLQMGIALPIVWSNVVEPFVGLIGPLNKGVMLYALPFRDARNAAVGKMTGLSGSAVSSVDPWVSLGVFGIFATVLAVLGWLRFRSADF
jgi:ABC-2 type transport system permease protein